MIKVEGLDKISDFRKQLALELARLDREISASYYNWTKRIFTELVEGTPQWSGDLAANWNYSVNQADYSYVQIPNKTGDSQRIDYWRENQGVFSAGHPYAVEMAMQRMASVTPPTWRDPVFIANATPIAEDVQEGRVKLRPVNLVGGAAITMYTVALAEGQRSAP